MPSLPALASFALLLSSVQATNNRRDTCTCNPDNQAIQSFNDGCYCCPGVFVGSDDNQYCCVGGTVSLPPCFPMCSGTATASSAPQSCQTSIYLTDSGYSSKAAAYTSGKGADNTGGQGSGDSSVPASTSAASGGSGGAVSGLSSSSSSSTGVAAAIVTSGPLMGAWMVAGGLVLGEVL